MPMFRVELDRRIFSAGERPRNPFLGGIPAPGMRHDMSVRVWEFEAIDEDDVRRYLQEAYDQDLPEVRGYRLRSIAEVREINADGTPTPCGCLVGVCMDFPGGNRFCKAAKASHTQGPKYE